VSVACTDDALLGILPLGFPEGVLLDLQDGPLQAEWIENSHALLAGPGLGLSDRSTRLLDQLLLVGPGVPRVFDADALNAFVGRAAQLKRCVGPLVITPHVGEAQRLLGHAIPGDALGRQACAQELARLSGAVVCLKGAGTVISDGGHCVTNATGNAGMATAGSGDVLAGMLVALLGRAQAAGQGLDLMALASAAVYVHGRAGDLAADQLGPRSVLASDLIEALPDAFIELG
jgi:hydroxyethylthiazole kinase-like uncharacterized protein yjeF